MFQVEHYSHGAVSFDKSRSRLRGAPERDSLESPTIRRQSLSVSCGPIACAVAHPHRGIAALKLFLFRLTDLVARVFLLLLLLGEQLQNTLALGLGFQVFSSSRKCLTFLPDRMAYEEHCAAFRLGPSKA